ncbi:glycine--tRNA ligase subunit beta [Thiococcus pfennigii]|uniref:glycine--tRNA ligase subunit beta n=1 Tax=Thiococcus pfennigii TaxID=1057 RepID=UPI0019058F9F|nr:glycine--tRNA ligase subunit beta [Thiococcus pfennigii]
MHASQDLLVEIGTEELPPTSLARLSGAFTEGLAQGLAAQGLAHGAIESFAAPRRLACLVRDLAERQPDRELVRRGPALAAAFDATGQPTKAALGFARSCGLEVAELGREETGNGTFLVARRTEAGQATTDLIAPLIEQALAALPIPKRMRWADYDVEFVRPVHWVCLVFGSQPVAARVLGIEADNQTRGHRFHHPAALTIAQAGDYAERLRAQGFVEPSFARRRARIAEQVAALAADIDGRAVVSEDLLDEVTALCEWPCALLGRFDEAFLEIPDEVLIETMQKNQKYFPLVDAQGALLPRFIAVANIESRDPERVRAGNERVIRPRFADAAFFWHQDLKRPLADFAEGLERAVFQDRLGTMADKSRRVARLAQRIAEGLGVDAERVARVAALAKCDLMTQMIFEFPSLQGTMGRYYALRAGEDPEVAAAIEEQYRPRHAGDALPASDCGRVLALAERIETLVGIFAIGQRPSGVKDPYALRRAAIGVLRLMIETPLALDLRALLAQAAAGLPEGLDPGSAAVDVYDYILERLPGYYQEQGVGLDSVEAVTALKPGSLADIDQRIRAVEAFRALPEATALAAANKRIRNILRKSAAADLPSGPPRPELFREPAEAALGQRVAALLGRIAPLQAGQDYRGILQTLAELRDDVDAYFEQVMVMADEAELRANRLRQLQQIEGLFLDVADISRLQQ